MVYMKMKDTLNVSVQGYAHWNRSTKIIEIQKTMQEPTNVIQVDTIN